MTRAPERVAGDRARRRGDSDLILGRYRLLSPIGEGATSTVWLGRDERLDRPVAVKILRPELVGDAASRRRLRIEATAAARLGHPNIVGVHDVDVAPGRAAIVLEHVPGRSLLDRLREGALPVADALRIGTSIASALAAAHALGIVHRDVKPANILLGDDGRARLADFGIATRVEDGVESDGVAGTLRYLAPERLQGSLPSPAADVWSLGVVLYEMLTGAAPFAGANPGELLTGELAGEALPLDVPGLPRATRMLVRTALDPDPSARPAAAELATGLVAPDGADRGDATTVTGLAPLRGTAARPGRPAGEVRDSAAPQVASGLASLAALGAREAASSGKAAAREQAVPAADRPAIRSEAVSSPTATVRPMPRPPRRRMAPARVVAVALGALVVALAVGVLGRVGPASPSGNASGSTGTVPSPAPSASPPAATPVRTPAVVAAPAPPRPKGHGHGHGHGG